MNTVNFNRLGQELDKPSSLVVDLNGFDDYFHDATEASGKPLAIILVESENDVIATLEFCRNNELAVVTRGAGTGLSGGCVPTENSVVLSVERMKALEINADHRTATCGPGVITKDLLDAAAKYDLTYPPDPASYDESTLGGNVAEGAGGLRCKRYGVTKDYVIGLKAITANGEIITTGIYNNCRGFCLCDVLIGSEGTLAIITEIAVRLIPLPDIGTTILVAFDKPQNAAQTVADITASGIIPTVLEYLDGDTAECSNQYEKTEGLDKAAAILLIETNFENKQEESELIKRFCEKNSCIHLRIEDDPQKADRLWDIRRNISNAVKEIGQYRISEDVAVTNSKFPLLVDFVAKMNRNSPLRINTFGHAGDGNLHVNFISMTGTPDDLKMMEIEIERLLKKAVALGGTLTGEHGIGLAKREFLSLEFNLATLAFMRELKYLFDPENLLNPGKIFGNFKK